MMNYNGINFKRGSQNKEKKTNLKKKGISNFLNLNEKLKNTIKGYIFEEYQIENTYKKYNVKINKNMRFLVLLFYIVNFLSKIFSPLQISKFFIITTTIIIILYSITLFFFFYTKIFKKKIIIEIILSFIVISFECFTVICTFLFLDENFEVGKTRALNTMLSISIAEILYAFDISITKFFVILLFNSAVLGGVIYIRSKTNKTFDKYDIIVIITGLIYHFYFKYKSCLTARENFIKKLKITKMYNYYNDILENMNCFFLTISNKKILKTNKKFRNFLLKGKDAYCNYQENVNKIKDDEHISEKNFENYFKINNESFPDKINLNHKTNSIIKEKIEFVKYNSLKNSHKQNYILGNEEKNISKNNQFVNNIIEEKKYKNENSILRNFQQENSQLKLIINDKKNYLKDMILNRPKIKDFEENIFENGKKIGKRSNTNIISKKTDDFFSAFEKSHEKRNCEIELCENYGIKNVSEKKKMIFEEESVNFLKFLFPLKLENSFLFLFGHNLLMISENITNLITEKLFFENFMLEKNSSQNSDEEEYEDFIIEEFNDLDILLEKKKYQNHFILLGEFTNEMKSRFYQVYFRKIFHIEGHVEFLIYDITKIKEAEKINVENQLKTQFFSKIAHEFKTPINSTIFLIKNVKQKICNFINDNSLYIELGQIENLSNYIIFLVHDIIDYSNISQENIIETLVDIKEDKYNEYGIYNFKRNQKKPSLFKKMKNDYFKINIEKVNLIEILNFCMDITFTLISEKEREKSVKIIKEYNPKTLNDVELFSDSFRLKQILLNILSNSAKFTKIGFIKMNMKKDALNSKISINIKDSGIGFDLQEYKKRKQNNFCSLNREYNSEGSGLGLSITEFLCKKLNISYIIKSKKDEGTEINLSMDYKFKDNDDKNLIDDMSLLSFETKLLKNESLDFNMDYCKFNEILKNKKKFARTRYYEIFCRKNSKFSSSKINLQSDLDNIFENRIKEEFINFNNNKNSPDNYIPKKIIFIIDDHFLVRKSLRNLILNILEQRELTEFYHILEAKDGVELLYRVIEDQESNNSIKCIITDENMEYMNGSEAIKILKKLEKNNKLRNIKVACLTAFEDRYNLDKIKESGIKVILSKPCSYKSLIEFFDSEKVLSN